MAEQRTPQTFAHGSKLKNKRDDDETLSTVLAAYEAWRESSLAVTTRDQDGISHLVYLLNDYKATVEPLLDARPNSGQEVLVSSILEEFFEYLFLFVETASHEAIPVRRPAKGFLHLAFHPHNLDSLVSNPAYTVKGKDHDFVLGGEATLTIRGSLSEKGDACPVVIPAVALECKRYLERNMLDECAGTAEKVKRATPYCLYIVVAEYLKMDDCTPELTEIDEIYVLRKQRNSERGADGFVPKPIDAVLVWDLYKMIMIHLRRIWWDPSSAVTLGKLFNF